MMQTSQAGQIAVHCLRGAACERAARSEVLAGPQAARIAGRIGRPSRTEAVCELRAALRREAGG